MAYMLVTLDSLGPGAYVAFGLVLILISGLIRGHASEPHIAGSSKRDGIDVRVQNVKVVPIDRNTRVLTRTAISVRRVGNYS